MKYDGFLEKMQATYDRWLSQGKIPHSSKVVPVGQSLSAVQWVLPSERVLGLIKDARFFALGDCACRTRYKRCDNPVETCIFINDAAETMMRTRQARPSNLEEIERVLELAEKHGLVHLTIYNPEQHPFCICSCCPCCCHDLQLLRDYGRSDLVARSEYVAVDDPEACVQCGVCVDRCVFGARQLLDGVMRYDPEACYGCGVCVPTCPGEAIVMSLRKAPGKKAGGAAG